MSTRYSSISAGWLLLLLVISGCATHAEMRKEMVTHVRLGEYERALTQLKKLHKEGSKKDLVMDLMDKGEILHLLGRYDESNRAFDAAKLKLDELFGTSIADELAAIAWNEASRAFKGEEFERIMINLIMAFNYLHLNNLEAAAVEARQLNHRLQVYTDHLARNKVKTSYKQDGFAQFLAGLIHEAEGDYNASFRSYEDALDGYALLGTLTKIKTPTALKASVLRAARQLGYTEAIAKYEPEFGRYPESDPAYWDGKARLVVIGELGVVAHKFSQKWIIPDPQLDTIVVTYPEFRRSFFTARKASLTVMGRSVKMPRIHDLSTLAINMLNDKNGQVKGRAVAKAIARYAIKKVTKVAALKSKNEGLQAASLIANLAMNIYDIAEAADTRSWMTLPDHLRLAVVPIVPGKRTVTVNFSGNTILDRQRFTLTLEPDQTRFLITRAREPGAKSPSPPAAPVGSPPHEKAAVSVNPDKTPRPLATQRRES